MEKNELEELEHLTRELQQKFNVIIEPYRKDLWRYCVMLTKSPWDAEDLMQETLLKAYATLPQLHQPIYPRPYLFRIASNAWVDQFRKKNPVCIKFEDDTEVVDLGSIHADEVIGAMEILIEKLSPRQVVIVLLIDVFDFKIREVADLLTTTEATIKSALQRARNRLRTEGLNKKKPEETEIEPVQSFEQLLNGFIEAYNRRDVRALVSMMDEHISEEDLPVFQVYGRDQMEKSSLAGWLEETRFIQARHQLLWGRTAIVVTHQYNGAHYLHGIMELSIEDGKIVKWRDYYFSKEFLLHASDVLKLPVDNSKELYGN